MEPVTGVETVGDRLCVEETYFQRRSGAGNRTGRGRWTEELLTLASALKGADISSSCVEACQQRFADADHAEFFVSGGRDLEGVTCSVRLSCPIEPFIPVKYEFTRSAFGRI